jgi:hypothetical protein
MYRVYYRTLRYINQMHIYISFHSAYCVLLLCHNNMGPRYRSRTAAEV